MYDLSWLNPTPHATAVYASCSALLPPHATLASRRPATALPGLDFHQLIAPALAGAFSLYHLVGTSEQCRRNIDAQHLRCLQVDDELEFSRHLHGHLRWFLAFEDPADIDAGLAKLVRK